MCTKPACPTCTEFRPDWFLPQQGFFGEFYRRGDNSVKGYRIDIERTREERTNDEVEGIIGLLGLQAAQWVMDCPCGWGRHSLELARRQINVTGVDLHDEYLATARRQAQAQNLTSRVSFLHADMRDLSSIPTDHFDAVINMFTSFGFFWDERDHLSVFQQFARVLRPGGRLLLHADYNPKRIFYGQHEERCQRELIGGGCLQVDERLCPRCKRLNGTWTISNGDESDPEEGCYSLRVHSLRELRKLCASAGLSSPTFHGDFGGSELDEGHRELILVARRPQS